MNLESYDFADLNFDNRFTRELPGDPIVENTRRQVTGACYSRVFPTPVSQPRLVAHAREVAELLDLGPFDEETFAAIFAGNRVLPGMDPFAMCYGGHQFGNWAGQLGDGRAINLGEVVNRRGETWIIQLKGAGPTPYSRMADGLAVLRSSVREFLCSEAMHHLGVPTTRALSLVLTGEEVSRDMFYDGNPQFEPGAVVCRVAPSFTRFGNFQLPASRGEQDLLRQLADYTIRTDFPHLGEPSADVYAEWFTEVCRTTAEMIVHWMRVGFVHGVMNTDNMSILGQTIDYGPYGWLEGFDPNWTPNTTDAHGRRYRFGHQPQIAMWNLHQLANTLVPLIGHSEPFEDGLATYARSFNDGWQSMIAEKLGLTRYEADTDEDLVNELMAVLQMAETDMTIFYRRLADVCLDTQSTDTQSADTQSTDTQSTETSDEVLVAPLADAYYDPDQITPEKRQRLIDWLRGYQRRVAKDGTPDALRRERMNAANPKYVLRNYLAQLAIDQAEQNDFSLIHELLEVLRHPYDEQPEHDQHAAKRPEWARHRAGCSMLSCSS